MLKMVERTCLSIIKEIIEKFNKMAFLSGPRQVGKTTLAKHYQDQFGQSSYFNWDNSLHQKKLLTDPLFFEKENRDPGKPFLVVLDEIHKYARWKNYLKGVYDEGKEDFRFLITGSGRLDLFKKGRDSLLGRYFSVPLFPFSMGELGGILNGLKEFRPWNLPRQLHRKLAIGTSIFSTSAGFPNRSPEGTPAFTIGGFRNGKRFSSGKISGMPARFGKSPSWNTLLT
jgi:predicted AAA+ superfamily ATPase